MTGTLVSPGQLPQERTRSLDIPLRRPTGQHPYWHRDEPVLAVARVDPGYGGLKDAFPAGWSHLVRAKSLLDGVAALDVPALDATDGGREQSASLVRAAAGELRAFAATEGAPGTEAAVLHAREAARRLDAYARTGTWEPGVVREPEPRAPWLYCGPLASWAMRGAARSIALLVAVPPAEDLQAEVDVVTLHTDRVAERVGRVLGGEVRPAQPVQPAMHVMDLLLGGGESALGHKNFAHFFPLEAEGAQVPGREFTVVFANIHRARLRHCSLRLFEEIQGREAETRPDGLLRASLRWFRGHDLAHFWRRTTVTGEGTPAEGLTPFERMSLEEAYADVLGLLSALLFVSDLHLSEAYRAEMYRYLSRRHHHFADTAAAVLTAGWLRRHGVPLEPEAGVRWLQEGLPALEELARVLHRTLWEGDGSALPALRSALASGGAYQHHRADAFRLLPTDLSYTFG
ncbi:hypothetical protein [Streptomyces sp. NRRL F-5727]|uniref:hypothetical protein n=1 Tax=Streptomyces sp. NRRL F-5727 TaxID=1463871 RepID=UPI0004CAE44C|nr:hypothetical protein [Streptomyces sp. NRRL F-5727]